MSETVFCHLHQVGLLSCAGKDALNFLQGQLSCDLNKVTPENTQLGAYCNPQGRMIATLHCFLVQDCYYLRMPATLVDNCIQRLEHYAMFSKLSMSNANQEFAIIGLYGTDAPKLLKIVQEFSPQHKVLTLPGHHSRFEVYIPPQELDNVLTVLNEQATKASEELWRLLDIEMGIPTVYPETQEKFLPQRANFHLIDGISFDKGCYVGQEIIARLHYRGKLKHHMYRLRIITATQPKPGSDIYTLTANNPVGSIVDSCPDPTEGYQALAILPLDLPANEVIIDAGNPVRIEQLDLPYQW